MNARNPNIPSQSHSAMTPSQCRTSSHSILWFQLVRRHDVVCMPSRRRDRNWWHVSSKTTAIAHRVRCYATLQWSSCCVDLLRSTPTVPQVSLIVGGITRADEVICMRFPLHAWRKIEHRQNKAVAGHSTTAVLSEHLARLLLVVLVLSDSRLLV